VRRMSTPATVRPFRITPSRGWPGLNVSELRSYRSLFYFIVWRDIKVRYAQTVLGAAWAVLQPVLSMVVFTIVFGRFARIPSDGVPYPVFSLAALVAWSYVSTALTVSSNSLITNTHLITKVYFPRLIIPFGAVLASLVDFAIALAVLLPVILAFGIVPSPDALLVIPLLVTIMVALAGGLGFVLSALNVQYRDVRHAVPFLLQIWMFASPIAYPQSVVPAQYRAVYALNPLTGVVGGFRSVLLRTEPVPWGAIGLSAAISAGILIAGALYFRRVERIFADVA